MKAPILQLVGELSMQRQKLAYVEARAYVGRSAWCCKAHTTAQAARLLWILGTLALTHRVPPISDVKRYLQHGSSNVQLLLYKHNYM